MADDEPEPYDREAAEKERRGLVDEIDRLIRDHARTWEGYDDAHVTAFHIVLEVAVPGGRRVLIEIADPTSSRHTAMGMLFAALHDPRWLDPSRLYGSGDGDE